MNDNAADQDIHRIANISNHRRLDDRESSSPPLEQPGSRNRPCDPCRRRKCRCVVNEGTSTCVLCSFHGQDCTYLEVSKPRKRKSVHLETNVDRIKRPSIDNPHDRVSHQMLSPSGPEAAIDDYANFTGPSLLKKTLGLQRRRHGIHLGLSGEFEPTLTRLNPSEDSTGPSVRHVSDSESFMLLPDKGTERYDEEIEDLDAIEALVHPHGKALIDLYFRIVHPSFPILHKKVYLEKYQRTHREFAPALLAAVYILALNFWSYSKELSSQSKPELLALEKLAFKAIGYAVYRPKLSTVEAGMLLLQRPRSDSWTLSASMVAVSQDLGLHLDCSDWKIPTWERGLRKRLAWAVYMQDTWASLVHGRPPHISATNWAVKPMVEKDFPENAADEDDEEGSTEVEKGRILFCHMVSLTTILAEILGALYSVQAEQELKEAGLAATRLALSKAKPLQIRLKEWHASLPTSLSIEDVKLRKLSSTGNLHLAYYATEITLHRRIIRTLSMCTDQHLIEICRTAAKARLVSTMGFVNRLRPEHLQSFWYFSSKFNFALVGIFQCLLCATAQKADEAQFYITRLDEYRWTLRVSSKSVEFLDQSMVAIDRAAKDIRSIYLDKPSARATESLIANNGDSSPNAADETDYEPLQEIQLSNRTIDACLCQSPDENLIFPDAATTRASTGGAFHWEWTNYEYETLGPQQPGFEARL